jgi:hypothetical protein
MTTDAQQRIDRLEAEIARLSRSQQITTKAWWVSGIWGDYVEFGAFRGDSLIQAYYAAQQVYQEMVSPFWDHAFADRPAAVKSYDSGWNAMRFHAFDSFEGLPKPVAVDAITPVFEEGTYACTEHDFRENLRAYGVDLGKVDVVKGFFEQTLTSSVPQDYGILRASVVHVDSDLYESARLALGFITPALHDGSIIIFDDWFQFHGNPTLGEQRAFSEWRAQHPDWLVTEFQKEGPFRNSFVLNRP